VSLYSDMQNRLHRLSRRLAKIRLGKTCIPVSTENFSYVVDDGHDVAHFFGTLLYRSDHWYEIGRGPDDLDIASYVLPQ